MTTAAVPGLRAPRQRRSERTLDRLLRATEDLLRERLFEQVSVADIVARAKTSVGAFYARFADKASLLPALYARYDRTVPDLFARFEARSASVSGLREATQAVARAAVQGLRERRGLMRAMAMHARSSPDAIPEDVHARRAATHRRLTAILLRHRDEVRHSRPEQAVEVGLFAVMAAARDKILFGEAPHARATRIGDAALEEELALLLFAYLTFSRPKERNP